MPLMTGHEAREGFIVPVQNGVNKFRISDFK